MNNQIYRQIEEARVDLHTTTLAVVTECVKEIAAQLKAVQERVERLEQQDNTQEAPCTDPSPTDSPTERAAQELEGAAEWTERICDYARLPSGETPDDSEHQGFLTGVEGAYSMCISHLRCEAAKLREEAPQ